MTQPATGGPAAVLPLDGRTPLAFEQLHGEALFLHALRAVHEVAPDVVVRAAAPDLTRASGQATAAGLPVPVVAADEWWAVLAAPPGRALLVHDPLCPLTPADFLLRAVEVATEQPQAAVVTFRPVTDTVKTATHGRISGTIDRTGLAAVTSPVVVPGHLLVEEPPLGDVTALVGWLHERGPVELLGGPAIGRRVDDPSAVALLECVDEVGRRVHHG